MADWTLKVRDGPRIERTRFPDLDKALRALDRRLDELEPTAHREDVQLFKRTIDASRLVSVRFEISGPRPVGRATRPPGPLPADRQASVRQSGRCARPVEAAGDLLAGGPSVPPLKPRPPVVIARRDEELAAPTVDPRPAWLLDESQALVEIRDPTDLLGQAGTD